MRYNEAMPPATFREFQKIHLTDPFIIFCKIYDLLNQPILINFQLEKKFLEFFKSRVSPFQTDMIWYGIIMQICSLADDINALSNFIRWISASTNYIFLVLYYILTFRVYFICSKIAGIL